MNEELENLAVRIESVTERIKALPIVSHEKIQRMSDALDELEKSVGEKAPEVE